MQKIRQILGVDLSYNCDWPTDKQVSNLAKQPQITNARLVWEFWYLGKAEMKGIAENWPINISLWFNLGNTHLNVNCFLTWRNLWGECYALPGDSYPNIVNDSSDIDTLQANEYS